MAQKLSHQLRASEDRIAELEAEVLIYQDRTERQNSGFIKSTPMLRSGLSVARKRNSEAHLWYLLVAGSRGRKTLRQKGGSFVHRTAI